ncbi:impB/mucB/samB family protein [Colletotrichum tofieldiae]|uniref:DNA repair protein REV1 n=1 Tax=Colletotrichum tofieldiae TaxID=708197 RepID=A0A166PMQ3_9PEZI|nr:impB/mucB/samB family protein [Colletotrichum tofieldiae]GKT83327.1 impB/mucB/samB family protein [Colletotrichum tofieldiae]
MNSRLDKNSSQVRKRIENHEFVDEAGEEYEQSAFGGFGDYFRRKKIKLQNLDADMRAASTDKPQIFKGVVAHVMGYTQPPLHMYVTSAVPYGRADCSHQSTRLHRELVQHGAGFLQYLDSKTMATHIIASSVPPKKSVDYSKYRLVKPAWVTESIEAGRLLPWSDYRVNNNDGPRQKVFKLDDSKTISQATPQAKRGYKEQTDASFYTSQFKASAGSPATPSLSRFAERAESPLAQRGRNSYSPSVSHPVKPPPLKPKDDVEEFDDMEIDDLMVDILPEEDKVSKIEELDANIAATVLEKEPKKETQLPETMTSEEHNAVLLSDPKIWKSSTANPDFLKQFYSESRLHHLSTWKAELKSRMQNLAKQKGASPKAIKRKPGSRRYIIHVDFDSFFCAVSLKKNPQYVDKPTVVAHSSGTASEIASCNYVARKFGVKNGMWMKRALELCPDIKVLPYDFPAYEEASRLFYESILELGGVVQSVSIDEALVDTTSIILSTADSDGTGLDEGSIWREQEKVEQIALKLRNKIKESTGCAVSVGIGGNILLAKVALRRAKPAGQFQIKPEQVLDVIGELEVKDLPGVAYSLSGKLEEIGVKFVKDIRQVSKERLSSSLGPKTGEKLWEYARGIDRTEVGEQTPRKSVSAEVNWGIRFINQQEAEEFILNLCKELERRLLNEQVKGKQFTMKIMRRALDAPLDPPKHLGHGKCDSFSKSILFGVATHNADTIAKEAVSILRSYRFTPGDLRGLGVQLTKLEPIKSGATGPESSQRRLAFPNFGGPSGAKKPAADPIEDSKSPQKPKATQSRGDVAQDPIADDPLTPRKPKVHPALALARAGENDAKAQTPLNIMGTQFILPSQVDPAVLAELPGDIRAKLQRGQRPKPESRRASPQVKSRSNSPAVLDEIPSQVDAEVFNALPDDMKAEVLAQYGRKHVQQTRLPQSPRKDRYIQAKKATTPTKRGGRSVFNNAKERQQDAAANRLQTNFLPNKGAETPPQEEPEELDQEFLAELPEDVRKEIIEDHRKKRLAKRSGLLFNAPARRQQAGDLSDSLPVGQTKLQFPAPPPKVNFMGSAVKSIQEIKDMLEAWHDGTRYDGPHQDDVVVFEKYLSKVVLEERDMHKASKLVHWLSWLVEEDGSEGRGKQGWRKAIAEIKAEVQKAVECRGLGPLRL